MPRSKAVEGQVANKPSATEAVNGAVARSAALVKSDAAAIKLRTSKLPAAAQLPLVVVLSFSLNALLYSFLNSWTRGELADVATQLDSNTLLLFLAWRAFELSFGWYVNYDSFDLAALNLLSHGPTYFLLSAFYGISPLTAGGCLAIETIAGFVPFLLLRPLSGAHAGAKTVPNRDIVADRSIQLSTTAVATAVYSAALWVAFKIALPTTFVLNFPGIARIEPALDSTGAKVFTVVLATLLGAAAQSFIFTPYAATAPEAQPTQFDPASATLAETIRWNVWAYSAPAKVAILRTAVVTAFTWANTYLQTSMTVQGVQAWGAAVYASAWAVAAALVGVALEVVGR